MRTVFGVLAVIGLLVGCATHANLPGGHLGKLVTMEQRSPLGSNVVAARGQHCEKVPGETEEFSKCRWMTKEEQDAWFFGVTQGQGGQIISGVVMGAAVGGAIAATGPAVNTATSSVSNVTNVITKGGHR